MFHLPDLTPLFYLAIVGLVAVVVAIFCGLYWLAQHIRFV